nr:hypothetical protein [Tanacetum cinerariifolium]
MEVDIEKDENEPELTYPYEEVDRLNPSSPASESEPEDVIEDGDSLLPGFMRRDIDSLFGRIASISRQLCGRETAHALVEKKGKAKDKYYVEKLGNAKDKAECKKLKKELEEARIMPPMSAPLTQTAIRRMIKEIVDAAIAADECAEGKKVKFFAATLQGLALTWWNVKAATIERVKVDAYIRRLTNNIKGEVTSSKPANLNEAVRMAHKLMEQKSQARDERILEGKKRKWENFQSENISGKINHKDNSRQTLQNNQKQGNAQAMVTAPTDGKASSGSLLFYERCFTRHVGPCTIKCHKCRKVGHKARYCKEKNVATGANAQRIPSCYDC